MQADGVIFPDFFQEVQRGATAVTGDMADDAPQRVSPDEEGERLVVALVERGTPGAVYNVCSGHALLIREIAAMPTP